MRGPNWPLRFFMEAGLKLHCSMLNHLTSRYQYTSVHCVTVHRMMKLIAFSLNRAWFLLYLFHSWIIFRCNVWLFRADFLTYLSHLFLVVNSSVNIVIYCWKDKKFHRCAEWWHNSVQLDNFVTLYSKKKTYTGCPKKHFHFWSHSALAQSEVASTSCVWELSFRSFLTKAKPDQAIPSHVHRKI